MDTVHGVSSFGAGDKDVHVRLQENQFGSYYAIEEVFGGRKRYITIPESGVKSLIKSLQRLSLKSKRISQHEKKKT